eukprot:scaffold7714_cov390-Prasinococcus_capsulatus_cf.AAC.5
MSILLTLRSQPGVPGAAGKNQCPPPSLGRPARSAVPVKATPGVPPGFPWLGGGPGGPHPATRWCGHGDRS